MKVSIDRQQGANAWMTIEIKEGKNREMARFERIGMQVNRLIRVDMAHLNWEVLKGEIMELIKSL